MKIALLGSGSKATALKAKIQQNNTCSWVQDTTSHADFDVFIDLNFDEFPERIAEYAKNKHTLFLLSAVCCTPELAFHNLGLQYSEGKFLGINALPGFIDRNRLEWSNPYGVDCETEIEAICSALAYEHHTKVESRVGMVTPRIICMIINEAFYTVQEGTATAPDIDIAMKLGTNYPKGPFEFLETIGVKNVYQVLESVYQDTHEERYKICPALKTLYLKSNSFN